MGSNAQAALELEIRKIASEASHDGTTVPSDAELEEIAPDAVITANPTPAGEAVGADAPQAPLAKPYLAGDVIAGKYKLTRIIGKGGMGAVWRAHNVPLDIDVAIKLIRRDRTSAGAAERLLTEARAAARLMHPSIVRVFDFGETEQGDPFIVMELLRGESLSAILRRKKRLSPAVAVQTMLPVAGALSSAHGKGIIHRDLKPDNVIIIQHENGALLPKIVDFGIAKLLDIERSVTLAGEVLGSPDYMSPEQARGAENAGEATDIWAFSVVLYELLTGARPFDGHNYNALIASILTNDPLPITARGVADGELGKIIQRGLAKDVKERWHRMKDLGAALAHWAVTHGIEDDVAGGAIAKVWLTSPARRVLTVHPEMDATVALPLDRIAPPAAAEAKPAPGAARPAMETIVARGPRRGPRLVWIAPVVACAAVVAIAAWLARDRIAHSLAGGDAAVTAVSAATPPSAAPAVSAVPSAAPTAEPLPTAEPAASAPPALSASAKVPTWRQPKRKAPSVPKNIKF